MSRLIREKLFVTTKYTLHPLLPPRQGVMTPYSANVSIINVANRFRAKNELLIIKGIKVCKKVNLCLHYRSIQGVIDLRPIVKKLDLT